ncbi:arginine--tRNA ligase [Methanococcoides sp. SA1]|nr:arginine--tRNA ligase [Methanococcoides sp. SA1]
MKDVIVGLLAKELKMSNSEIDSLVEVPLKLEMGDFAFPCFGLAKKMKKAPVDIAGDLASSLKLPSGIDRVEVKGAYLNFFVDRKVFVEGVFENKKLKPKKKGKIIVEMSSPNIAKPFGIGHLRSTIIGNCLAKICEANGFEVVKINYPGDWGTQFGKIIFGWKKWGDEEKLEEDAIGHLQELYVKVNASDEFEDASREEFRKLEEGDVENLALWKRFRELSLGKFQKIYDFLGIDFDEISGESFYSDKMDGIVDELKKKKIAVLDEGAMIVDMKNEGLGVSIVQKSDGTSLYATRDIAAAVDRKKRFDFVRMIYEVGAEQKLAFQQFFKILEKMRYSWSKDLVHVAHGLYLDKDGKKFSTRKGKTVYMQDILDEVLEKAKANLEERGGCEDLDERARAIALAAIFYGDLKNNRGHNMVFDIDKFLEFQGDTGPYLLYSYARASSLLEKVKSKAKVEIGGVEDVEFKLMKKIGDFEDVVGKAYDGLAPNLVANYCYELARQFNEFYHACPVLGGEKEGFRLAVVEKFRDVMGKGLDLLGIEKLEEM